LLAKLLELVEEWRGGPGPRASDIAVTQRECADELEALLEQKGQAMSQRNVDDDLDWDYARSKFQELGKAKAKLRQYEPIIEAARAWRGKVWLRKHRIGVASGKIESNLVAALDALETAEKEER
jgi:hypothetical protein